MAGGGAEEAVEGLAEVVDELYVLAPADFTSRRDELAKAARAGGDKALAAAVRRLHRPTTSAWALNLLAREEPDLVGQLLGLGALLRDAQAGLDGAALRELDVQRRSVVGALARRAGDLAAGQGHPLDAELSRQVEQSLGAALADPDAGAAVTSGQLTRPVSVVGFGVDVDPDAVAVPTLVVLDPSRRRATGSRRTGRRPPAERPGEAAPGAKRSARRSPPPESLTDARARREQTRREQQQEQEREARRVEALAALEDARAAEAEAGQAAQQAASRVDDLRARLEELRAERDELAARLADCEEQTTRTTTRLTQQEEEQDEADEALVAARRATRQAERGAERAARDGRDPG